MEISTQVGKMDVGINSQCEGVDCHAHCAFLQSYQPQPPETQIGRTLIQVVGLRTDSIRITEPLGEVLSIMPPLVSSFRHYHPGAPIEGASVVHIALHNVSHILPNIPHNPAFWTLHFRDETELRVVHPLPANL